MKMISIQTGIMEYERECEEKKREFSTSLFHLKLALMSASFHGEKQTLPFLYLLPKEFIRNGGRAEKMADTALLETSNWKLVEE